MWVASGNLNAFDAGSMFKTRVADCTIGEGSKNYVVHFEPNRDRQGVVKPSALSGIKAISKCEDSHMGMQQC